MILITVFLFFLISLFFVLLLVDIILLSNLEIQKINLGQQAKIPDNFQVKNLKEDLTNFNRTISDLDNFYRNQFILTNTIEQTSRLLLSFDLYLSEFNFTSLSSEQKGFAGQIYLSGFAKTRDSLLDFKNSLENIEGFQEISFPSSNWVRPSNINFTVKFKINDK